MTPPDPSRKRAGKGIVGAGALVAVIAFVSAAVAGWNLGPALLVGFGAGAAAMIALGVAQAFLEGRRVDDATLPGGAGVTFEKAVADSTGNMNDRVTQQMDEVNERLFKLEEKAEGGDDGGEKDAEK